MGRMTDFEIIQGKGSWVTTSCGRTLLDFTSGIGVTNLGHCHPHVVSAIQKQAATACHIQVNIAWHSPMLNLVDKLQHITPAGLDTFFFWNSGAEAVEASIKLARHATKKQNVIVFNGSYHGRTYGTMGLTTSKTIYRAGFGPFPPSSHVAPFPKFYQERLRHGSHYSESDIVQHALEDVELLLKTQSAPSETAAFLIEPVLGEGGYIPAPKEFMQGLREISKKNDILLIADEIQTGFGRTGKFFAMQTLGVDPDILIFAKGIASGLPLSGIASTYELMSRQPAGSMGGTFAGNAVSCAAALATLDVFEQEKILENVAQRGPELWEGLLQIQKEFPCVKDIRGLGLMIGVEFGDTPVPISNAISKACADEGLLLLTTSIRDVVRFIPPLNVSKEDLATGLQMFRKALSNVLQNQHE